MNKNEQKFCEIVNKWEAKIEYETDWYKLYNVLFMSEIGDPVARKLQRLVPFDWYDPDASYEDDVRAFVNAAIEKRREITSRKSSLAEIIEEVLNDSEGVDWETGYDGWVDVEELAQKIAKAIEEVK